MTGSEATSMDEIETFVAVKPTEGATSGEVMQCLTYNPMHRTLEGEVSRVRE